MNILAEIPNKVQPNKIQSNKYLAGQCLVNAQNKQQKNHLLASMSENEMNLLKPDLEEVDFTLHQVLCEADKTPTHMYFPSTAIVSLLYMTENGNSSEVAVIGNDGAVGMSLFFSGSKSPNQALVQVAGKGYRIRAQAVKNAVNSGGAILNILLRYSQAMITQVAQTAVCNRHHTIDQILCRRLLLSLDRLPTNEIYITQEMLASTMGVRRESVTDAALKLQKAGIIRYRRGQVTVLNRKALESRSCECYAITKVEQTRLQMMSLNS